VRLDTLVTGGTVVTATATFDAAVAIRDGQIVGVGDPEAFPAADRRIDVGGDLVMPGVVDPHVHVAGYNSRDSYATATAAAAAGGVTTVVNFAWQGWRDGDWGEGTLREAVDRHRADAAPLVDYGLHAVITRESEAVLDELPDLVEAGVTSVKMFTTDDAVKLSNGFIGDVFDRLADTEAVGMVHTEDHSVCERRTAAVRDETEPNATGTYPRSRPDYSEAMAAESALRTAVAADAKYYGVHTTSEAAADVIADFREDGSTVRAETCTHYTVLDESTYEELGNRALMSPPLRTPTDRDALFERLRDGTLSVVSTDHVPLQKAKKEGTAWWDSPMGVNSLQTSLPVFFDEAVHERDHSLSFLVRRMCLEPARTFGLPRKGRLEPGADADLVVFDPDATDTLTADRNHSEADYSIYEGRSVTGRVRKTFVRGRLVTDDGEIVADPGHGEFRPREIPDWSS
jgi:dihydropyrimidinase